ncbi:hypothetical protein [Microbacterium sp. NPDC055665]
MHDLIHTADVLTALAPLDGWGMAPTPKSIDGVDEAINTFVGWALWIVSVLSLIGLLIVLSVGYESYRHNQAEEFMEKAKAWVLAAIIGAYAKDIVGMFFPGFKVTAVATAIPGLEGPVTDIIGNFMWLLGWAAFACIIFLAIKGFLAYKSNGLEEFVGKFFWFIVASLGISFVTNIAGAFFPAALTFG